MMVFIDIDDTLVDHKGAERAAAIEFHGLHPEIFREPLGEFARLWRTTADKHFRRYLTGEISFQEQRRARIRALFGQHAALTDRDADALFDVYLRSYEHSWRLFTDVEPCLTGLRGIRLGIISNGDSHQQSRKLASLGVLERFSVIVLSADVGVSKPDPKIFTAACRAAGADPSDCWYVGDDLTMDAQASTSARLRGVWLNRSGTQLREETTAVRTLPGVEGANRNMRTTT